MRVCLPAAAIVVGDEITGVGKVASVTITGDTVKISTSWIGREDWILGVDCMVWLDRREPVMVTGP